MLPHSLFSLPHSIIAIIISGNKNALKIFAVTVALLAARSGANAFNRFADYRLDLLNPRTKNRPLPTHEISKGFALHVTLLSFLVFRVAVLFTTPVCIVLMPLAVGFCLGYSFTKRFTPFCHLLLGLTCGLSVLGPYICLYQKTDLKIILLYLSLALQVAGFDMLYSIMDADFDKKYGLHSFAADFGITNTVTVLKSLFFISNALLTAFSVLIGARFLIIAVIITSVIMQQSANVSTKKDARVLGFNGVCSVIILAAFCIDLLNNVL